MNSLLDIDQLRTFLAIVETGSFTRAAEIVHKTQSAVSMQMNGSRNGWSGRFSPGTGAPRS